MKLSFQKNDLLSTLQVVGKAVASKTTLSIMECVLVDATEGQIRLTGNKNDFGIESICPGDILEAGKIALEARLFQEIIKRLPQTEGKNILLEGQLGSLKDPDHGIYPMVTSSSTLAAYGAIGAGIAPYDIKEITTVVKAYSSAVGAGEFVSEIEDEAAADELRKRGGDGGEFGATTGRPRRMGWFDAVASRYGVRIQGTTEVALTVLDVLGYLKEIPVCVGYDINGEITKDFPTTNKLKIAKPVYEYLPGWNCDIRGIKKYEELPENCRKYIEFIEKELEVPVKLVSNGPGRDDIIYR